MSFNQPPNTPPGPQAPAAPPPPPAARTLADVSAMGTTQGAPVMAISKGPLPGSGPPPAMPGNDQAPAPPAPPAGQAPVGVAARPVVAPHANTPSVGTHPSKSANKRGNPVQGMTND